MAAANRADRDKLGRRGFIGSRAFQVLMDGSRLGASLCGDRPECGATCGFCQGRGWVASVRGPRGQRPGLKPTGTRPSPSSSQPPSQSSGTVAIIKRNATWANTYLNDGWRSTRPTGAATRRRPAQVIGQARVHAWNATVSFCGSQPSGTVKSKPGIAFPNPPPRLTPPRPR